jgi:hypothetical protein
MYLVPSPELTVIGLSIIEGTNPRKAFSDKDGSYLFSEKGAWVQKLVLDNKSFKFYI